MDSVSQLLDAETEQETRHQSTKKHKRKREKINVKIQVIHEQPDKTPPIVGYFPSGYDPLGRNEAGEEPVAASPMPTVTVNRNKEDEKRSNRSKRLQLVVSPPESNVDFVGSSHSGEAAVGHHCTYALGILDKETQILKIVPVACNKIFRMEPRVRGLEHSNKESLNSEKIEITAEEKADKMRELTSRYGSKKSIKKDKKMLILKQEDDPSSQKDLDEKIKEVKINKEALETTSAHVARNIPPHNISATTAQQAYPLDKIILKGEWNFLEDIYELLQAGTEVASSSYPTFVCNRIHKLQNLQGEAEKRTLSCIFSYITHLIKFKDLHSLDGASSAKNHWFPNVLRQKFMNMFGSQPKRLSVEKIDLLISYALVLSLHVDDFQTDPTDIAKDLRMSQVTLRTYFEHLGCKFKRVSNMMVATLPVPIQFPELRQKRRRRG